MNEIKGLFFKRNNIIEKPINYIVYLFHRHKRLVEDINILEICLKNIGGYLSAVQSNIEWQEGVRYLHNFAIILPESFDPDWLFAKHKLRVVREVVVSSKERLHTIENGWVGCGHFENEKLDIDNDDFTFFALDEQGISQRK